MTVTLSNGAVTAQITDIGAELISVRASDGFEYIWNADPRFWNGHAPILFPICGRLRGGRYTYRGAEYEMRIHGFARDKKFEITEQDDTHVTLVLCSDAQTLMQYPFDFELTVSYKLDGNTLLVSFAVRNTGSEVMPFIIGWHPGFTLESDIPVSSFSVKLTECEPTRIPVVAGGRGPIDGERYPLKDGIYVIDDEELAREDTIVLLGAGHEAYLSSDAARHSVLLEWSDNLPCFCIWRSCGEASRFVCLEPWSGSPTSEGTPDDFEQRRMNRLSQGECEEFCYKVSFK